MSKESIKEARESDRQRAVAEIEAENKRIQEFKATRDPIYNHIYWELKKTRKWVAFMGIMLILSLIGTVIILIGTAALTL